MTHHVQIALVFARQYFVLVSIFLHTYFIIIIIIKHDVHTQHHILEKCLLNFLVPADIDN